MKRINLLSTSAPQTQEVGRLLGDRLVGGEWIELCGPLGAGKTHFAKGLALGLGVPESEPIVSPTFVLLRRYEGRLSFIHGDAYRLTSMDELLDLGLEEILEDPRSVVAVEWADRFPGALQRESIRVEISYSDAETHRHIAISLPDRWNADDFSARFRLSGISVTQTPPDYPERTLADG